MSGIPCSKGGHTPSLTKNREPTPNSSRLSLQSLRFLFHSKDPHSKHHRPKPGSPFPAGKGAAKLQFQPSLPFPPLPPELLKSLFNFIFKHKNVTKTLFLTPSQPAVFHHPQPFPQPPSPFSQAFLQPGITAEIAFTQPHLAVNPQLFLTAPLIIEFAFDSKGSARQEKETMECQEQSFVVFF